MVENKAIILEDHPASEDDFFGGGHQRSADALSRAVEQLANKDGAIGLEGAWGSGKSTVINLASKHFLSNGNKERKHHVFTFDLWLHHPEMLKLAFLEEFITWAHTHGFLSKKQHSNFIERVSDREVTTRVENKREFKLSGVLFVLLFPLLPLIYTWLSPLAFSNKDAIQTDVISIPVAGFGLTTSELAALGLVALYVIFAFAVGKTLFSTKSKNWLTALSSGARLFSRETDFDSIKQNIRERNPTSEEFQNFFREILASVQKKNDRIVFVFDNIDRLPTKSVQKVWSDCRSIFAMQERGIQRDNSSVTAIIPYDAKFITEAFAGHDDDETKKRSLGENLIRKTFNITIRVAPALSTDWKLFLERKLAEAFPEELPEAKKYELFRLFDVDCQDSGTLPTPRSIISYVNEIGSVWNQWGDKIDLSHIAQYILVRRRLELSPDSIKSAGFIHPKQRRVLASDDVMRSIAALHYNVEPEHAYQILLGQDIRKLAISDNREGFLKLTDSNGFSEVFPDVVVNNVEQWARDGADNVALLAENISQAGVTGDYLKETWSHLAEAGVHFDKCDTSDLETYRALSIVLQHVSHAQAFGFANQVMTWVERNLPKEDDRGVEDGRNWMSFVSELHTAMNAAHGDDAAIAFIKQLNIPKGAALNLGACAACASEEGIEFNNLKRSVFFADMKPALLELASDDLKLLADVMHVKPNFVQDAALDELTTTLCNRLNTEKLDKSARGQLVYVLTKIRSNYRREKSTQELVEALATSGALIWHAMQANSEGDPTTAGSLIWLLIDSNDGNEMVNNPVNHAHLGELNTAFNGFSDYLSKLEAESEAVGEIAQLVVQTHAFSQWEEFAITSEKSEIFRTVHARLIDDNQYTQLWVSKSILAFEKLKSILDPARLQGFITNLQRWAKHAEEKFSSSDALKVPPSFLYQVDQYGIDGFEVLGECVDSYLDGLDEAGWVEIFDGGDQAAFELLLARIEIAGYKPPLERYRDTLLDHSSRLLDGKASISGKLDRWSVLFGGLKEQTLKKVAKDVLINLEDATTTRESVEKFLSACAPLVSLLPLTEHPDIVVDQLLTRIVASTDPDAVEFINTRENDLVSCANLASEDVADRLREALENMDSTSDDNGEKALAIAVKFGVTLTSLKLGDEDEA